MIIHNSVSAIRPSTHRLYRLDYIRHIPISAIDLKYHLLVEVTRQWFYHKLQGSSECVSSNNIFHLYEL